MRRKAYLTGLALILAMSFLTVSCVDYPVINLATDQLKNLSSDYIREHGIPCVQLVKLSGKINHFGMDITQDPPQYIDYHDTVPDVHIWVAEKPETKDLLIKSDETGWWTAYVLKLEGIDAGLSLVYEKEGWVTTKSNVLPVTDEDDTDLAIQYIDPTYYNLAIKPALEAALSMEIANAMVVTVGKSWASMHDDRLPHGDAGAFMLVEPEILSPGVGPIYFNEAVQPDPYQVGTSVDGGVTWINVPFGQYDVSAEKDGFEYDTVRFDINESDVENGVVLYIASPPDSVQGSNDSEPGED